jgi:hypothetical protein
MKKEFRIINELFKLIGEWQGIMTGLDYVDNRESFENLRYQIFEFKRELDRKINLLLEETNLIIDDEVQQTLNEIQQI